MNMERLIRDKLYVCSGEDCFVQLDGDGGNVTYYICDYCRRLFCHDCGTFDILTYQLGCTTIKICKSCCKFFKRGLINVCNED